MINSNLIKLAEKIKNNSEYAKNMQNLKSSQELYDYCSKIVDGYTKKEFDNFIKGVVTVNKATESLSDNELKLISGGGAKDWLKNQLTPNIPDNTEDRINYATSLLSMGSSLIKTWELIYFDDLDNMSPEEFANYFNGMMQGMGYN